MPWINQSRNANHDRIIPKIHIKIQSRFRIRNEDYKLWFMQITLQYDSLTKRKSDVWLQRNSGKRIWRSSEPALCFLFRRFLGNQTECKRKNRIKCGREFTWRKDQRSQLPALGFKKKWERPNETLIQMKFPVNELSRAICIRFWPSDTLHEIEGLDDACHGDLGSRGSRLFGMPFVKRSVKVRN